MSDPGAPEIDIGTLLDDRHIGRFHVLTFTLCMLILIVDGLDFSAVTVASPAILAAFHAGKDELGIVFSSVFVGILAGSVVFGFIGDRYGRKRGAVLGVLAYSIPALLTPFSGSMTVLATFRALAGLGIGGVIPNVVALLNETSPKRMRVTFVMLAFVGYSTGNAAIGQLGAWLIPLYGWPVVFVVAGATGIVLSLVVARWLPESIPFIAATRPQSVQLRPLVMRAAPELNVPPAARLVYRRPPTEANFSLKLLFTGYRRLATPVLWLAFFAESMTYLTLAAWLVVILKQSGVNDVAAARAFSYAQLGAIAAIVTVARLLDRLGPRASALSALIASGFIAALGLRGISPLALIGIAVAALAFASATHQSLLGMVGQFYPTIVRGNGIGYATGIGRFGAMAGPALVGYLMTLLPLSAVLAVIAAPDLVVAVACLALDRIARNEIGRGNVGLRAQALAPGE